MRFNDSVAVLLAIHGFQAPALASHRYVDKMNVY